MTTLSKLAARRERRVCPECGDPAGDQPFCQRCGRNLSQEERLPTRREWEKTHRDAAEADVQLARRRSRRRRWIAVPIVALLALLAAAVVGVLVAQHNVRTITYHVGSMEPTLTIGSRVTFDLSKTASLHVGEVVLFHPPQGAETVHVECDSVSRLPHTVTFGKAPCAKAVPEEASNTFVKRIVAGPGEWLYIKEGHVYIAKNKAGPFEREHAPYIKPCGASPECNFLSPIAVPSGAYYMLGDNRGESDDSRFWGAVPRAWIIGRAVRCSFFDVFCSDAYTS